MTSSPETSSNPETLSQLLSRTSNSEILSELSKIDEKNLDGYKIVLAQLRRMTPASSSDFRIILSPHPKDEENETEFFDISAEDHPIPGDYRLAIEYAPWDIWLASPFRVEDIDLSQPQILAWCLWEMTWAGFDQEEIQEQKDDLIQKIEDIKNREDIKTDSNFPKTLLS